MEKKSTDKWAPHLPLKSNLCCSKVDCVCLTLEDTTALLPKAADPVYVPPGAHKVPGATVSLHLLLSVWLPSSCWSPSPEPQGLPIRAPALSALLPRPSAGQQPGGGVGVGGFWGDRETFGLSLFCRPGLRWNFKCSLSTQQSG